MLRIDTIDLRLQDIDFTDSQILFDIDTEFGMIKVQNNKYNQHMVKSIDFGELQDNGEFIDRFGLLRPVSDLSTGCKTAILLGVMHNKTISTLECGMNAILEIVTHCRDGHILMYNPMNGIPYYSPGEYKIDVKIDDYRFLSLDRLNHYFTDERPFEPDMSLKGVERLC